MSAEAAGLLTRGSPLHRLPGPEASGVVAEQASPLTAAGPSRIRTGFPHRAPRCAASLPFGDVDSGRHYQALGAVPLAPFVLGSDASFYWASILVGITFFAIGAAKSLWSLAPWWQAGLETLAVGASAAALAYAVGHLLQGFVPGLS